MATALMLMAITPAMSQSDAEQSDLAPPDTEQGGLAPSDTEEGGLAPSDTEEGGLAQSDAEPGPPVRPGDAEGRTAPSDGLAECAAILVVASEKSRNFIAQKNMSQSSQDWFAEAGLLALDEVGAVPDVEIWEGKVSDWSGRIGSVDAMARHPDWMAYCSAIGGQYGLDVSHFTAAVE